MLNVFLSLLKEKGLFIILFLSGLILGLVKFKIIFLGGFGGFGGLWGFLGLLMFGWFWWK